jgi:hypothetical protein
MVADRRKPPAGRMFRDSVWHRGCSDHPRAERGRTHDGHRPPRRRSERFLLPRVRIVVDLRRHGYPGLASPARRCSYEPGTGRCRASGGGARPGRGCSESPLRSPLRGGSVGARHALTRAIRGRAGRRAHRRPARPSKAPTRATARLGGHASAKRWWHAPPVCRGRRSRRGMLGTRGWMPSRSGSAGLLFCGGLAQDAKEGCAVARELCRADAWNR